MEAVRHINDINETGLKHKKPICITNINAVTPTGVRENVNVLIKNGKIGKISHEPISTEAIFLNGCYNFLIPGFIDFHCDTLESYLEPRPGSFFPIEIAISELDKMITSCGVTTMYHCVAFEDFFIDPQYLRNNDYALRIINGLINLKNQLRINFKIHIRLEIFNQTAIPIIMELIKKGEVDLISFIDHTPGQGQFRDIDKFIKQMAEGYGKDLKSIKKLIKEKTKQAKNINNKSLKKLTRICRNHKVPVASHDDSKKKVEWAHSMGCNISEFPINLEAAEKAHQLGMYTVMGAPNIVRGGSQSGNIAARELIERNYCDILCSDYSPMSMLHAIFQLVNYQNLDWHEAVNLVSLNPARAVGLDNITGSIETDKDADLLIVDKNYSVPRIRKVYRKGVEIYSSV